MMRHEASRVQGGPHLAEVPRARVEDPILIISGKGPYFPRYPLGLPRRVCRVCHTVKGATEFVCCGKETEITIVYNGKPSYRRERLPA